MSATTRVSLSPAAAFCIKSTALNSVTSSPSSTLGPPNHAAASPATISIPSGLKVFVNIAWDTNVPPPPDGTDAAIQRAISADSDVHPAQAVQSFVPVILSDPRLDTDKAGKPSAVFDAIFNSSLKSRTLRSPEFKTYLIELTFQRIEAQYGLLLSRQIGTPNILSKGKLQPRSVLIPTSLYTSDQTSTIIPSEPTRKPLIEELPASASTTRTKAPAAPPKGILKNTSTSTPSADASAPPAQSPQTHIPELSWSRTDGGRRLRIALSVPHLTRSAIPNTTLDIEARRLIFSAPSASSASSSPENSYTLDLDLSQPDSDIEKYLGSEQSAQQALTLKRQREFDVDGARAEWRIAEGQFIIYA
ncbi:pre-RNA processing PIH1/Nop17-domain-containing protein [Fomes fomentarius]|nr:pre-RNA processing PIH1/Nop17-domain-containing protein [Fomes fomentarius]